MSADIVAIGQFKRTLVPFLQYPAECYAATHDGAKIAEPLFTCHGGTTESRALAECFGIDAMDFNQHHLDPRKADLIRLRVLFSDDEVATFVALREAGFSFYFMPNA